MIAARYVFGEVMTGTSSAGWAWASKLNRTAVVNGYKNSG